MPPGKDRSASVQGGYQAAAIFVCMAIGIGGGLITGYIAKQPFFEPLPAHHFDDNGEWTLHLDNNDAGTGVSDHAADGHAAASDVAIVVHNGSGAGAAIASDEGVQAFIRAEVERQVSARLSATASAAAATTPAPVAADGATA